MTRDDSTKHQDAWLADTADQILNGEIDELPVNGPDPETRALAGTLLRLKRAFPSPDLDPGTVRRMEKQILKRWETEKQRKPGWLDSLRQTWQMSTHRQQYSMAFTMIAIAGLVILAAPLLFSGSGDMTATAGTQINGNFIWIVLFLLAVCLGWFVNRRS